MKNATDTIKKVSYGKTDDGRCWVPTPTSAELIFFVDEYNPGRLFTPKYDEDGVPHIQVSKNELKRWNAFQARLKKSDVAVKHSDPKGLNVSRELVCDVNDHEVTDETTTCPLCGSVVTKD